METTAAIMVSISYFESFVAYSSLFIFLLGLIRSTVKPSEENIENTRKTKKLIIAANFAVILLFAFFMVISMLKDGPRAAIGGLSGSLAGVASIYQSDGISFVYEVLAIYTVMTIFLLLIVKFVLAALRRVKVMGSDLK